MDGINEPLVPAGEMRLRFRFTDFTLSAELAEGALEDAESWEALRIMLRDDLAELRRTHVHPTA